MESKKAVYFNSIYLQLLLTSIFDESDIDPPDSNAGYEELDPNLNFESSTYKPHLPDKPIPN
jgi:hypothetical protein